MEATVILPIIMVILALIISIMVKFVTISSKSAINASEGDQICDMVDETETDMLLNSIYDFIEVAFDE